MAEGAKDQERNPETKAAILDLFPLKRQSVLIAFTNLDPRNNSFHVTKAVEKEIGILGRTNIYASSSFGNLIGSYTEDAAAQLRRGYAICHQALRLGAKGELPKFTEQFVQGYDDEQDRKVKEVLNREKPQSVPLAELAIKQKNLAMFREFEPVISKIVESKLRAGSRQWKPEEDDIYRGFMDLYFLFREGCSDPKNFAEKSS